MENGTETDDRGRHDAPGELAVAVLEERIELAIEVRVALELERRIQGVPRASR